MKKRFAIILGTLALALAVLSCAACSFVKESGEIQTEEVHGGSVGGMIVSNTDDEQEKSGITFSKQAIPLSDYEENGISPLAESAYTITATIADVDSSAMNTEIVWSCHFEGYDWFEESTGVHHSVSNYLTVTYGSGAVGSKTATISCLQCFGKPIILTAKCKYDTSISASLQIDYAPKITSIYRDYYGEIVVLYPNQKTVTNISKFNINSGTSGIPRLSGSYAVKISKYYTLEDEFYVSVNACNGQPFNYYSSAVYLKCNDRMVAESYLTITKSNMATGHLYGVTMSFTFAGAPYVPFNASIFNHLNIGCYTPSFRKITSSTSLSDRLTYFSVNQNSSNGLLTNIDLCDLKFTFTGEYSSTEFLTTLHVNEFVSET